MKSNKIYFLIGFCFILIAAGAVFVGMKNLSHREARLETQLAELTDKKEQAEQELDVARNKYRDQVAAASLEETGAHSDRVIRDIKYIADTLKPAYNWTSSSEYSNARDTIVDQIGEDSIFAKNVIPPLETTDASGKAYTISLDENDLNMKCMLIDVFPAKEKKGKSAYYALVSFIPYYGNDIEKQEHLTRKRQLLYIVMDAENSIKSIEASDAEDIRSYDTGNNM